MIYTSPCIAVYYDVRHGEEYKDHVFFFYVCFFVLVRSFFYQWDSVILKFSIDSSFFFEHHERVFMQSMELNEFHELLNIDELINIESAHICVM